MVTRQIQALQRLSDRAVCQEHYTIHLNKIVTEIERLQVGKQRTHDQALKI